MEPESPAEAELRPLKRRAIVVVASCLGLGYSPIMPGTCGAALGVPLYLALAWLIPGEPLQTVAIFAMLALWSWLTIALGDWAERYYTVKDSQIFVTDEVAGFLMTVLLFHNADAPIITALWAFPVTRVIDILKVPPARQLEKLPSGWGVLADDLLGSVYAAALLWAIWYATDVVGWRPGLFGQ
jgi:phosphatidylglycerophosphatase A